MTGAVSPEEYMVLALGTLASQNLKVLLETKHLYQRVDFDPTPVAQKLYAGMGTSRDPGAKKRAEDLEKYVKRELSRERLLLAQEQVYRPVSTAKAAVPTLVVQNVGLHCKKCSRREAFAPIWYIDATTETLKSLAAAKKNLSLPDTLQVFHLVYQCQRCVGAPESFMVFRTGWSLALHGRSPMETIEIPIQIPKLEQKFYRDALIAYDTGKILAAIFYLRTFIEQFGRRITGKSGKVTGDAIFDAYADTLPPSLKDQMPSLREWYDKLSEPLHSATEDSALFESA
jgi:hypothetical protein